MLNFHYFKEDERCAVVNFLQFLRSPALFYTLYTSMRYLVTLKKFNVYQSIPDIEFQYGKSFSRKSGTIQHLQTAEIFKTKCIIWTFKNSKEKSTPLDKKYTHFFVKPNSHGEVLPLLLKYIVSLTIMPHNHLIMYIRFPYL